MREVGKIVIKEGSDFWKSMQKDAEMDAEKAASQAAEKARKETLERAEKIAAERKAYLDSIRFHDELNFKTKDLQNKVKETQKRIVELRIQLDQEFDIKEELIESIQAACTHNDVLEMRTSWKDEYDEWHPGNYERKCIECHLVEESSYKVDDRNYGSSSFGKKYNKLEKSSVVHLRKIINDKEYELEFNDLTW